MVTLRIGIHTSIARPLEAAALKSAELGANRFQSAAGFARGSSIGASVKGILESGGEGDDR